MLAAGLASCMVGPDYERPTIDTPTDWRIEYPEAADVANLKWWEPFGDPELNALVDTALRENRDLRIAAARVDQFIGALATTRAHLYPQIGYGADASRTQITEAGPSGPAPSSPYFSLYQASLGAAWQVDLFGRVRRQTEAAQENLISVLLGRNPGPIPRGKAIDELVAPLIPGDLPSTLLLRRPDILQAEQNLVAANASIGAARGLYYPNISVTGAIGSASVAFSNLLESQATAGTIGAGVTGPIFTFGLISGQVASAEAAEREALAFYEQTILNAFRETNDALIGSQKKLEQLVAQQQRVDSLREFARLARLRFDKGVAGYLDVLVAENELFAAELAATGTLAERYAQLVAVYRAVGGGWVDIATEMSEAARPATVQR
jgi:outer membrane protein TolC